MQSIGPFQAPIERPLESSIEQRFVFLQGIVVTHTPEQAHGIEERRMEALRRWIVIYFPEGRKVDLQGHRSICDEELDTENSRL